MLRDEAQRGSELPGRCTVTVGREQGCGERGGCEPPSAPGWHSHTETQQHPEDPGRPLSYRRRAFILLPLTSSSVLAKLHVSILDAWDGVRPRGFHLKCGFCILLFTLHEKQLFLTRVCIFSIFMYYLTKKKNQRML